MSVPLPAASQTPSRSLGEEVRQLLRLGGPIALVQLGMTALNFVDVAMLGRHDAKSLPAMALGATLALGRDDLLHGSRDRRRPARRRRC